jgi:hypothetical protein
VNGRYHFDAIEEQLSEPGAFVVQFEVSPPLYGKPPVQLCTHINVAAGPPRSFDIKARALRCAKGEHGTDTAATPADDLCRGRPDAISHCF